MALYGSSSFPWAQVKEKTPHVKVISGFFQVLELYIQICPGFGMTCSKFSQQQMGTALAWGSPQKARRFSRLARNVVVTQMIQSTFQLISGLRWKCLFSLH